MSFLDRFFRKRRTSEFPFDVEYIKRDIPLATIARWYIYDTELAEPNEVSDVLGMTNVSEEGDEKEREDSDIRLDNIEYLMPFLNAIAEIGADVITGIQVKEITDKNPDDKEEIEREIGTMSMLYKVIGMAAVIGAFSTAMEIGLIKPGEITEADWLGSDMDLENSDE